MKKFFNEVEGSVKQWWKSRLHEMRYGHVAVCPPSKSIIVLLALGEEKYLTQLVSPTTCLRCATDVTNLRMMMTEHSVPVYYYKDQLSMEELDRFMTAQTLI